MKKNNIIEFNGLMFYIKDEYIYLAKCGKIALLNEKNVSNGNFVEVQVAGEDKPSHLGIKMANSSESAKLKYVSHSFNNNKLVIIQQSNLVKVESVFEFYDKVDGFRTYSKVENISNRDITLEEVSSFCFTGLSNINDCEKVYIYRFLQSHHSECQPIKNSFKELGLYYGTGNSQRKISFSNIGSWSTKEQLPQAIIQKDNNYLMFEIENNNSWYYEISDKNSQIYFYLGGANISYGSWCKNLKPNESYQTCSSSIVFGNSLNSVIGEMTKYRRNIVNNRKIDENLPTIFNEYMHLSWDSPSEQRTMECAKAVAKFGVDYYVIDCGWHNEEDGNIVYPYVGQWKESKKRFPKGVRFITDYIRSLGMKAGLWIEPEIVGVKCQDMIDYYDDDCFVQRNGRRIAVQGRYFLDFRNKKVVDYMTETIRRMVEDYGADYIKTDYNQDMGVGTDLNADSFGDGLEQCAKAYLKWIDDMQRRFSAVIFENCSSGGMRMDYNTLSHFSITSTSDQIDYKKYPYIAGNILSSVLPEQSAVWSYPVDSLGMPNEVFIPTYEKINQNVSAETVAYNMINSLLGRMHLASYIAYLSDDKKELIKEGVEYYNVLTPDKKQSLPYLPIGFTNFSAHYVASGIIAKNKIYLAVWNMFESKKVEIPIEHKIKNVKVGYPKSLETDFTYTNNSLTIDFKESFVARLFEIEI